MIPCQKCRYCLSINSAPDTALPNPVKHLLFAVSMSVLCREGSLERLHFTFLCRGALSRDLRGFEIEAIFMYCESERRVIDDDRRSRTARDLRARFDAGPRSITLLHANGTVQRPAALSTTFLIEAVYFSIGNIKDPRGSRQRAFIHREPQSIEREAAEDHDPPRLRIAVRGRPLRRPQNSLDPKRGPIVQSSGTQAQGLAPRARRFPWRAPSKIDGSHRPPTVSMPRVP